MRILLVSIISIFLFAVNPAYGQYFEGRITFSNTYKSKIPKPDSKELTAIMGDSQEYYISNGNYKIVSNGTFAQWQMYLSKENKLYYKMSNSEKIFWSDASNSDDSVLKSEIRKNAETIAGYLCDELIFYCKSGVQKYYYNNSLAVNPGDFRGHSLGNWNEFVKISKSVPLKMIISNSQFTIENTALSVHREKPGNKVFLIPEHAILEKSQ